MIDRYQELFSQLRTTKRLAFCPFAILGHPSQSESLKRIQAYLKAGCDMLELGLPFSDPIADGPVIQAADHQALSKGFSTDQAMEMIEIVRQQTDIPIGILTYANIVCQRGIHRFYSELKAAGADSLLIADVPLEEIGPFLEAARSTGLHQIMMVSEYTTSDRLQKLQQGASGFLYLVSTLGVTGAKKTLDSHLHEVIRRIRDDTALPLMIGFGISHPDHIRTLKRLPVEGVIVGSALVSTSFLKLPHALYQFSHACR